MPLFQGENGRRRRGRREGKVPAISGRREVGNKRERKEGASWDGIVADPGPTKNKEGCFPPKKMLCLHREGKKWSQDQRRLKGVS